MARKIKEGSKTERRSELVDEREDDEVVAGGTQTPAGADALPGVDGDESTNVGGGAVAEAAEAEQFAEVAALGDLVGDKVGDAEINVELGLGNESLPRVNLGFGDNRASQDGSGGEAPTQSGDSGEGKPSAIRDIFGDTYDSKDGDGVARNSETGSWFNTKDNVKYDAETGTTEVFYKQGDTKRTSSFGDDGSLTEHGENKDGSEWESHVGPTKDNGDREISRVNVTKDGTATEYEGTIRTGGYTEKTTTTADGTVTGSEFKTEDNSWHNSDGTLKSSAIKDIFAGGDEGPEGTGATPGQVNRAYDGQTAEGKFTNSKTGAWFDSKTNTEYNPETGKTTTFGTDDAGNRTRTWTKGDGSHGQDTVNADGIIIGSVRTDADGTKHVFSEHPDGGFSQETFKTDGSAESVGLDSNGDLHVLQFDQHGNEITFDDVIDDLSADFDVSAGGELGDVFDAATNTTTHADGSTTHMRPDGTFEHRDAQGRRLDPNTGQPVDESETDATPTSTTPQGDGGGGDGDGEGGSDGNSGGSTDSEGSEEGQKDGDGDGDNSGGTEGSDDSAGGGEGTDGEEADDDAEDASQPAGDGQGNGAAGGDEIDLPEYDESTAADEFWADPTKAMLGQPGEGDATPAGGGDPTDHIVVPESDVGLPAYAAPSLQRVDPLDVLGQPAENEDLSALEAPRGSEDWVINPSDQMSGAVALGDGTDALGGDTGLGAPSAAMLAAFPEAYGQSGSPVGDALPVTAGASDGPAAASAAPRGIAATGSTEEEIQMAPVAASGREPEEEDIQMSAVAAGGDEEEEDIQMSHTEQEEEEVQASPQPDSTGGGTATLGDIGIGDVGIGDVGAASGIGVISSTATDLRASVFDSPLGSDLVIDDIGGDDGFGEDLADALD